MQLTQPANNSKNALIIAVTISFLHVSITQVHNDYSSKLRLTKNTSFEKYIIHGLVLMMIRHQLLKENKTTNFKLLILLLSEVLHVC